MTRLLFSSRHIQLGPIKFVRYIYILIQRHELNLTALSATYCDNLITMIALFIIISREDGTFTKNTSTLPSLKLKRFNPSYTVRVSRQKLKIPAVITNTAKNKDQRLYPTIKQIRSIWLSCACIMCKPPVMSAHLSSPIVQQLTGSARL